VVLCFFGEIVAETVAARARRVATLTSEAGRNPVWEIEFSGHRLAVYQPGVGAPLAAGFLEEVIAMGGRKFVACGGAGALVPGLDLGHPVVVDGAVRDEGTSHHYAPPARVIDADPQAVAVLRDTLARHDVAHTVGRTWTTDALYRETRTRVERRVAEGCVTVEMEAAALFAVARYRDVTLGQLLIAGDTLAGETWDHRGWMSARDARERLFWLAVEAVLAL
jgi:uridine phosphorylase